MQFEKSKWTENWEAQHGDKAPMMTLQADKMNWMNFRIKIRQNVSEDSSEIDCEKDVKNSDKISSPAPSPIILLCPIKAHYTL